MELYLHSPICLHGVETALPSPLFNDGSGVEATQHRRVGSEMNLKGFERRRSCPNRDTIQALLVARLRKTTKDPLVRISGITAEIRTVFPPNTNVKRPP
jgi:hypothetical protein